MRLSVGSNGPVYAMLRSNMGERGATERTVYAVLGAPQAEPERSVPKGG